MIIQVQQKVNCSRDVDVAQDFDKLIGKALKTTHYPLNFDWGWDRLGYRVSFCQALHKVHYDLADVVGDVWAVTSTSSSDQSPASLMVLNMTGIFREVFPYLAETVPSESFEAELVEKEHTTGITYPFLTLLSTYSFIFTTSVRGLTCRANISFPKKTF